MQHSPHNLWPEVGDLTFDDEVRSRVDRARQLRAQAVAEAIVAAYDSLAHALRASAGWLARRRREAQTRYALEQCSDRILADIGIRREQIALVAKALDPAQYPKGEQVSAHGRLDEARARRREQLRVRRELMLYSDEELNELGIRRGDIPEIARAA